MVSINNRDLWIQGAVIHFGEGNTQTVTYSKDFAQRTWQNNSGPSSFVGTVSGASFSQVGTEQHSQEKSENNALEVTHDLKQNYSLESKSISKCRSHTRHDAHCLVGHLLDWGEQSLKEQGQRLLLAKQLGRKHGRKIKLPLVNNNLDTEAIF